MLGIDLPEPEDDDPSCQVEPDNWDAVEAFCRCSTQWVFGAMGGAMGLSYPGVESVLRLAYPETKRAEVFAAIQVMERAALAILNNRVD